MKRSRLLFYVLLAFLGVAVGVVTNIATSQIPPWLQPYLWLSWPILIILALLFIVFSVLDAREGSGLFRHSPGSQRDSLPSVNFPDLWIPINHSKARIDYVEIHDQDQKSNTDEILQKYYRTYVGRFYRIDTVDETSNSLNYRVKGIGKKPILLRIHKKVRSEFAINTLQTIQSHIFEKSIVVHPLNETQGKNKINCVHEGVQDGPDKKEL